MKTIFITISRGSLIRNFFHTGVIGKILENSIKVVILSPNYKDKELFEGYEHDNLFFEPLLRPQKKLIFLRVIRDLLRGAVFNKTVNHLYKSRLYGKEPSKILYLPRIIILWPLHFVPGFKKMVRWFDFKLNPQTEHDYLFDKYKPDLVFATTAHATPDVGVLKSAKRLGIKTVQMPKSWDNLSKILFNVKTDFMLVWSPFMKQQALRFQDYKENEVLVTGIPQFDFYKKENLISREEFCKRFNFDPNKKIILYGSNGVNPDFEYQYPQLIKETMDKGELKNVQVLVRPHLGYLGDADQYDRFKGINNFTVDTTDKQNEKCSDHWDPSLSHLYNLYNSLYHADVCVTMASTLNLDAIACGTPVVNIKFDAGKKLRLADSVRRFYRTDYVQAITDNNCVVVAENAENFIKIIKKMINGETKFDCMKFIERFMYKLDNNSANRVATDLIKIINL